MGPGTPRLLLGVKAVNALDDESGVRFWMDGWMCCPAHVVIN